MGKWTAKQRKNFMATAAAKKAAKQAAAKPGEVLFPLDAIPDRPAAKLKAPGKPYKASNADLRMLAQLIVLVAEALASKP